MSRYTVYIFFLFFTSISLAQKLVVQTEEDLLYREDQFYIGVSYNVFAFTPSGMNPEGISAGFQFGFLRDFPINKRRNLAIAFGAGFSYDQFGQNLFINENEDGTTTFEILDSNQGFIRNRLGLAIIEAPIEFRWRSSTESCRRLEDLPPAAMSYLRFLAELMEVPIAIVSLGANRDQTIVIEDPIHGPKRALLNS